MASIRAPGVEESRGVWLQTAAKGMIMARDKCSAEEAFDILTRISQQQNVKVRDLAHLIVDAGKK